ncbi:lysophospholipid acyltransferase family protein [Marivivens sp. LCG002]|uniref:lysophospholipid acyltransferase family protein n=1 Tax=Marivivens sp. LCG002 TaxID=3051171 RepID=UPI0025522187|nr:lysophospholipid acyltransferase family protein [Marivivens sp. LCG002]WIV52080.1 lysophospholipid acyltransferase family protein [Marivivens sp. LCG002]
MSMTWRPGDEPEHKPISLMGWVRVLYRGIPLGILVFGCLILLLLVRLIERPLFGVKRPLTPYITQFVCLNAFRILGIGYHSQGTPMTGPGAVVANHSSWLDIFALNGRKRIYFVSKAEVAKWPGIGWLARATGTVFIRRDPREAAKHIQIFKERLTAGHKLLFFPEGTSTDGRRVLPFKPTLFAAFFDEALRDTLAIQPVSVIYRAAEGEDPRQYGWWGDMDFGTHLLETLSAAKQGSVTLVYHAPVNVADYKDRKVLARDLETAVRSSLEEAGVLTA